MENILNLTIDGMHCGACVRRVSNALESIPGIALESVEVGSARVIIDPAKSNSSEVIDTLGRIGFPVRVQE